jgi:hypothetical protein
MRFIFAFLGSLPLAEQPLFLDLSWGPTPTTNHLELDTFPLALGAVT